MSPDDVITFSRNKLDHMAHILPQTERRGKTVCSILLQYGRVLKIHSIHLFLGCHNPVQLRISHSPAQTDLVYEQLKRMKYL